MIIITIALILFGGLVAYYQRKDREEQMEYFQEHQEIERKNKLKDLIENRETRTSTAEFNENEFWELIDRIRDRSGDNYANHLGLFKDFLDKYTPEQLIELDTLANRLFTEYINTDLRGAATIIFKNSELSFTYLLMGIFLSRGEVFFKQACGNPDLIIGKQIDQIDGRIITDIIADIYLIKSGKLMPYMPESDEEIKIEGEPWTERDLPSRFSKLWEAYA